MQYNYNVLIKVCLIEEISYTTAFYKNKHIYILNARYYKLIIKSLKLEKN